MSNGSGPEPAGTSGGETPQGTAREPSVEPVVGVVGGGQLGRMTALAGVPMGLRFRFLEPKSPSPVDWVGEVIRGRYDDPAALERFGHGLAVATYEFENVPVEAAQFLERETTVHPAPAALEMAQDRLREKDGFTRLGIPTNPYRAVETRQELEAALEELGRPAMLKTRRMGYDGKGQARIVESGDLEPAWQKLGGRPLLLESFVDFTRELSLVAVRGLEGEFAAYPLVENVHTQGILHRTTAPAPDLDPILQDQAEGYVRRLMDELGYVGTMAVEFFQVEGGLLANEMAPRVHNSGHWTQDGAVTSQFENHLRAILGLPLGSTEPLKWTVMLNLLGELPPVEAVLHEPLAHVHLYGKSPRPGRKIGHVNVVADSVEEALKVVARIEAAMPPGAGPV
ncbi:MAG: 5-(carboxyamino)imidazole ribonucleotide synthase [Gemmatimonadales bacterium]|nr:MAG: 5-(carboxyamino)imidazole ribonucleotide synthase [Gemmatimonadales bacterium]